MTPRSISVVIPARGGQSDLDETVESLRAGCTSGRMAEIVIVDDASESPLSAPSATEGGGQRARTRLVRSQARLGVARARNRGVELAEGELIFSTDSHVTVEAGWDAALLEQIKEGEILACAVTDRSSDFRGYGCHLVVPHMGTHWNLTADDGDVQIASAAATALYRSDFMRLGGYDESMVTYGAAEPEFSVRAWLSGLRVRGCPKLTVSHKFKERPNRESFLSAHRADLVHNCLRFGLLYLDRSTILAMLRLYSLEFPKHLPEALSRLDQSDVWAERDLLAQSLPRSFSWFVEHFDLHDQGGNPLGQAAPAAP